MCQWLWRSSSFLLLLSVAEVTSEPLVGVVDDSGSVGFASVDDGVSALGP